MMVNLYLAFFSFSVLILMKVLGGNGCDSMSLFYLDIYGKEMLTDIGHKGLFFKINI